ncbi:hypothetical protein V6N11_042060 [Hibiscus sabdariffa]|uniref:Uncharacterized protein n=1 Tax=Hibiscus sabdariffa TaxID=183260 RepID=A0ABR2QVW4_9ROSI
MNSSAAAALFLFFLLSANPFTNGSPVFDTDGDELLPGVQYYIRSAMPGAGGVGLGLESLFAGGIRCPKFVAQSQSINGLPVTFRPANTSAATVSLSTDVNIEFPGFDAYCRSSNTWRVSLFEPLPGVWWVANGGERGNPGPQTLFNWFKIEQTEGWGYKLVFCPSVCESCVTLCNDVGRIYYETRFLLGLTKGAPWPFVFVKHLQPQGVKKVVQKQSG